MNPIHPKVAVPTLVSLGIAIITAVLQQYFPTYLPNAAVMTALNAFVTGLVGYLTPNPPA
jgi:hypothetical protein